MKLAACFLTSFLASPLPPAGLLRGFPPLATGDGNICQPRAVAQRYASTTLNFDQQCWQPADAIKLNQMFPCNLVATRHLNGDCSGTAKYAATRHPLRYTNIDDFHPEPVEPVASLVRECPKWDGLPLHWMSAPLFRREPQSGIITARNCDREERSNNVTTRCHQQRLLLLERAETDAPAPFDWHNARFTLC